MFDDNKELLQGFVEEGREMLDEVDPLLVELEKIEEKTGEVDAEVINTIFRLFHSLKGGAGFLNLVTVKNVTHDAETLLDLFRKGKAELKSIHVDLMTQTCDFIRQLLDEVETHFSDSGFEDEAEGLIRTLQTTIDGLTSGPAKITEMEESYRPAEDGGEKIDIIFDDEPADFQPEDIELTISEDVVKQFETEGFELIETAETGLMELERNPEDFSPVEPVFRAIHSLKGNAGFLGYGDIEKLSHQAENALDKIRNREVSPSADIYSLLLEILDFIRNAVNELAIGKEPRVIGLQGLLHLLEDMLTRFAIAGSENTVKDTKPDGIEKAALNGTVPAGNDGKTRKKASAAAEGSRRSEKTVSDNKVSTAQKQSIRVEVSKLDSLLDLVGELVITEAMVAQNPDIKSASETNTRLEKSLRQLDKITRDIQDTSTAIRMTPLAGAFRRMIRLVRDLSHKANKKVDLEIIGEETEVDKTVIEQITDPLVHIIRNAIDHGIDSAEERVTQGKPESGRVRLEAKHIGGEVRIIVSDDGRGLNRDRIIEKAISKGLIEGDGSEMTDDDVWGMVFMPGFSTAAKVTDVSGRGVGMDVVKRNIESIRGRVEVKSKENEGTKVILRIPLTLAIIDGMIIRLGRSNYIIPIIDIKESFRPRQDQITHLMDGSEIVNMRGQLLPVVRINDIFGVGMNSSDLWEGIIIVVESQERTLCLFVDELVGQQQVVIKGLSNYVGDIGYVSGCTILGDGMVSLIIDVTGIADTVENQIEQINQGA